MFWCVQREQEKSCRGEEIHGWGHAHTHTHTHGTRTAGTGTANGIWQIRPTIRYLQLRPSVSDDLQSRIDQYYHYKWALHGGVQAHIDAKHMLAYGHRYPYRHAYGY